MTSVQLMPEIADCLVSCEDRSTFKSPAGGALAFAPGEWRFRDSVCPGRFGQQSLALFDALAPTRIDSDLTEYLKSEDRKTEANVLAALDQLGYEKDHLAIFD